MVTKTKRKLKETNSAGPKIAPAGTTPAGTTPDANQPQSDLSIGDLRNLSTVIDVASTRGAFRANEMAMVGAVYNKLQAFLARVTPADDKKDNAEKTTIPTGAPIGAPATKK
jgi:hypothetical protein|tara:strand:- start:258 stop:593 length:336 start_codon:yes stop_codon:yes gene_type:complete